MSDHSHSPTLTKRPQLGAVRLVNSEDWVEVWVNGALFSEGHSFGACEAEAVLKHLGYDFATEWVDRCRWCCEAFPEGSLRELGGHCQRCRSKA